jgi:hypothetical protein
MRIFVLVTLLPCIAVAAEPKTAAQQYKNIQSLKTIPAGELIPSMEFMAGALGVDCGNCHVNGAPDKDDKEAKRTARKMVTMMQKINHDFFGGDQEVTCATCHGGRAEPLKTPPLVRQAAEAKEGTPPSLTPQQLFDKYVGASGGGAAWQKLRTQIARGKLTMERGTMPIEVTQSSPNHVRTKLSTPQGDFEQGYDGKSGWRMWAQQPMDLSGGELDALKDNAPLNAPLAIVSGLADAKVRPDDSVGKSAAHVVTAKRGTARERLWFDAQSGLLVKRLVRVPTPLGDLTEEISYEDYRTVDGVREPFSVRHVSGGEERRNLYSEIVHNLPVDEKIFAKPAPQTK